jgi:hypothetical protein
LAVCENLDAARNPLLELPGVMEGAEAEGLDGKIVEIELRRVLASPRDLFEQEIEPTQSG